MNSKNSFDIMVSNERSVFMKKSIVNFIIGVLVGAIMATAGIYAYIELSQNNSEPSSSMGQPPQIQNGDNSQPPQSQGDNNLQQPPEKPDGDNSNADNGNAGAEQQQSNGGGNSNSSLSNA